MGFKLGHLHLLGSSNKRLDRKEEIMNYLIAFLLGASLYQLFKRKDKSFNEVVHEMSDTLNAGQRGLIIKKTWLGQVMQLLQSDMSWYIAKIKAAHYCKL